MLADVGGVVRNIAPLLPTVVAESRGVKYVGNGVASQGGEYWLFTWMGGLGGVGGYEPSVQDALEYEDRRYVVEEVSGGLGGVWELTCRRVGVLELGALELDVRRQGRVVYVTRTEPGVARLHGRYRVGGGSWLSMVSGYRTVSFVLPTEGSRADMELWRVGEDGIRSPSVARRV